MASIYDLVGAAKQASDLEIHPVKVRYQEATQLNAGQYFRMTLPKIADDAVDCRSIRLKFLLTLASTDPAICVDGTDVRTLFNRVRVLSGSQVLFDLSEASQFFQLETNVKSTAVQNGYSKYLQGNGNLTARQTWGDGPREYVCTICPEGSILNTAALLPLARMSDLHIEIWLSSAAQALWSPANHTGATYNLKDVELLADYVRSKSVSAYFNSNAVRMTVQDVSHRFNNITSQQNLIRLSSAHTSLNKVLTVIRTAANPGDISVVDKQNAFYSGANFANLNLFVNNVLHFEEALDSLEELYGQLVKACPAVERSDWFDTLYATTRNVIAVNLQAAPIEFTKQLSSGIKTSDLNSDVVIRLGFTGVPAAALRADSYLISDALLYLEGPRGELKVKY